MVPKTTAEELTLIAKQIAKLQRDRDALLDACRQISTLWPEPPNCADILSIGGINDGRSRAIIADTAIKLAREAVRKAEAERE